MPSMSATDPTDSLFSRARLSKKTTRRIRGFMALPGELRHRIYDCYFQDDFRCEIAAKGHIFTQKKPQTVNLHLSRMPCSNRSPENSSQVQEDEPCTLRMSRPLGKYNPTKGRQTCWSTSLFALTLVCKQVHSETVAYSYRRTTYVFAAPCRIMNFLSYVSKPHLLHITKLHLHYSTYGDPQLAGYGKWQVKHLESWNRTCNTVSKKLINLRQLDIWIHVNQCAPKFNLREKWLQPILELRRLTRTKRCSRASVGSVPAVLEIVSVHFSTQVSTHSPFDNPDLIKASDDLHVLFGRAISSAILGTREQDAMAKFNDAWNGKYRAWQYHLGFVNVGW